MENKRIDSGRTEGASYGRNVVRSIIALAAKEIGGVASLHGKGIRAEVHGKNIKVDVYVDIEYGYSVPDVAFRIQENIKRGVETMTEYKISTVNVNILSVHFPRDEITNIPV
jgi:uncharacterized alkaline shock family protein YloU